MIGCEGIGDWRIALRAKANCFHALRLRPQGEARLAWLKGGLSLRARFAYYAAGEGGLRSGRDRAKQHVHIAP